MLDYYHNTAVKFASELKGKTIVNAEPESDDACVKLTFSDGSSAVIGASGNLWDEAYPYFEFRPAKKGS